MTLLILGIVLWIAAHFFKRLMPELRARMGPKGRGPVALLILASVILMIWGYRVAPVLPVYQPLAGAGHANNLAMLVSVYFFGIGSSRGILSDKIRHPMLWGVVIWAAAHLLVNGDWASVLLFGGIGLWAIIEMVVVNRTAGGWAPPPPRGLRGDLVNLLITLIIFAIAAGVHLWLGHSPFLGTYG